MMKINDELTLKRGSVALKSAKKPVGGTDSSSGAPLDLARSRPICCVYFCWPVCFFPFPWRTSGFDKWR